MNNNENKFILFPDEEEKVEVKQEFVPVNPQIQEPIITTPEELIINWDGAKQEEKKVEQTSDLQNMINKILKIDKLEPVKIPSKDEEARQPVEKPKEFIPEPKNIIPKNKEFITEEKFVKQDKGEFLGEEQGEFLTEDKGELLGEENSAKGEFLTGEKIESLTPVKPEPKVEVKPKKAETQKPVIFESKVLEQQEEESKKTGIFSILARYGDDFCARDYVTHPAIGREEEIKQLNLTLLTPEKSAILVGKPGIGKTSIVEGLAYDIQRGDVPDLLKGYSIISIKTPSLLGTLPSGETRLQTLVDELAPLDKVILFIDEIHMLIGANSDSAMDFANMFKESLGRGQIKLIGATTTEEYERYILRDKAFARRFQQIEVLEPSREHTIKILMGTLPKIEKETGAKMKYTSFQQSEIMAFITDITSEYKRIYGIGSRYPDICLTLLKQAFSQAMFENRKEVTIIDVRNAIENSTNIYPDVIRKELINFDNKFRKMLDEEKGIIS